MELPLPNHSTNRSKQILLYYVGRRNGKNLPRSKKYHKKYATKISNVIDALAKKNELFLAIPIVESNSYFQLQHPAHTALLFYTKDDCQYFLNKIVKTNEASIELLEHHRRLHEAAVSTNTQEEYDKLAQHLLNNEYLIEFIEEVYFEEYDALPKSLNQRTFLEKVMCTKAKHNESNKNVVVCLQRGALVEAYDKESDMWWPYMVITSNGRRGNRYMNYTSMCLYPRFPECSFWQGWVEEKNLHLGPYEEHGKLAKGCWRTINDQVLSEVDIDIIQQRVLCNQQKPPETFNDIINASSSSSSVVDGGSTTKAGNLK